MSVEYGSNIAQKNYNELCKYVRDCKMPKEIEEKIIDKLTANKILISWQSEKNIECIKKAIETCNFWKFEVSFDAIIGYGCEHDPWGNDEDARYSGRDPNHRDREEFY